tara:strand:+ start:8686 stop:10134 length:1449 start_codon:yes stop_codon:yes gene_type:complete
MNLKFNKLLLITGLFFSIIDFDLINAATKDSLKSKVQIHKKIDSDNTRKCEVFNEINLTSLQDIAINKNKDLENTKLNIEAAEHTKNFYKKYLWPTLSITATIDKAIDEWTDTNTEIKGTGLKVNTYSLSSTNTNTLQADIIWNILNPSIYSNIKSANFDLKNTQYLSQSAFNELLKNLRLAAISVNEQSQNIESTKESISRAKKLLEIAESLFDAGFISRQDLLRQQNHLLQYENLLKDNKIYFNLTLNNLNLLLNNEYSGCPYKALDSIQYISSKSKKISSNNSDLILLAFRNRSDIKSLEAQIKSKEASIEYYKRASLPLTSLYISSTLYNYNYDENAYYSNERKIDTYYDDYSFGISTTSKFSGGQNKSMIKNLKVQIEALNNNYKNLKDTIVYEINNLLYERDTLKEQFDISKEQYSKARETYNAIEQTFAQGYSTMTELLDAQRMLSSSQKSLIRNESERAKNLVKLFREISFGEL